MAIFKGAGVAIVTPMNKNEEVNYDKLEELINIQIDQGTDAIIIAGTAQEQLYSFQKKQRALVHTDFL